MSDAPHERPARPDEIEPSAAMRAADRANGEPEATSAGPGVDQPDADQPDDDDGSVLVTDPPGAPQPQQATEGGTGPATLVTDDPAHPPSRPRRTDAS